MTKLAATLGSVVVAALTFTSTAFGLSQPTPYTVLTVRASAGLVPEGRVMQEISLRNDGSVHVKELIRTRSENENGFKDEVKEHESLWEETPEVMAKIFAALEVVKGGELQDQEPGKPAYADGLYISYEIVRNGKAVQFAKSAGGHEFIVKDPAQRKAARYLRADLNELRKAILSDDEQ